MGKPLVANSITRFWDRLISCFKRSPHPPTHLGGQNIPTILGICERCGAMVIQGLHQQTETGYLCQRCAGQGDETKE
ncbi:MAG: hypothetical protein JRI57_03045 [Deltaproteobacteria bacterium]|nr:hypothetical protein [Deltaproteobacteria bacterium]MBW1953130.1 hypothetical protein [Deltaproteobacteria bacterium]MBW1987008.1 hypothetical protein [Deltaproteobacteria bacterium]MBW2134035.1 hypothetical protein [Deltaproteobacteria bacterium]